MSVEIAAAAAKRAGARLIQLSATERADVLQALATLLLEPEVQAQVLKANQRDCAAAQAAHSRGELAAAQVNRLGLDSKKLQGLADGLRLLAQLPDPIGQVRARRELDAQLVLEQITCPLGVLGVVFEARPDALIQIVGLALKSGNAVLLKGGREALDTNRELTGVVHRVLNAQHLPAELVVLLEDRAAVDELLTQKKAVDLIIARGSSAFIRHVQAKSQIPVMAHADGICHLYLHAEAAPEMAAAIAVDAKCSYPSACNSIETLLWEPAALPALERVVAELSQRGVELRADPETRQHFADLKAASEADWDTEYGDLVLSIRAVPDLAAALEHIAKHGSRHTEAIVTHNVEVAAQFLQAVDAAAVFHNASTRFCDGYRFGLGAEVGISTDKLHARGPVGIDGLVTYRWLLHGAGQVSTDYGPGKRAFTHRAL